MKAIDLLKKTRRDLMFMWKFGFRIIFSHMKREELYICADSAVHGNMGDQALGFCRKEFLIHRCGIKPQRIIEYSARDRMRYWDSIVKFTNKRDVICLRGGGYWGDLWIDGFLAMLDYIDCFYENRIIVFPQSVFFTNSNSGQEWLRTSQAIVKKAKDFHFFTRDEDSKNMINALYPEIKAIAVPDTVLSYKPENEQRQNRARVLLCFRNDKEKLNSWSELVEPILQRLNEEYFFQDTSIDLNLKNLDLREEALKKMWGTFGSAKLVVTDRLHGMIFSAITGTPCLVFDNIDGKVEHEYQWIKDLSYMHFYDGNESLNSIVEKMLYIQAEEYPVEKKINLFDPLVEICTGS